MTQALSVLKKWNPAPVGPVVGEPHGPANYCADLSQLTENEAFLFAFVLAPLFGGFSTFTAADVDAVADTIEIPAHGLSTGDPVRFGNVDGAMISVLGSPLDNNAGLSAACFYAIAVDADTLQFSLTSGGSAADLTAGGSGTHYLFKVPEMLRALVGVPFTPIGAASAVPGGSLLATLGGYFLSTLGGRLSGPLEHFTGDAKILDRLFSGGSLPSVGNSSSTIVGFEGYPCWRQPDQSADHALEIPNPTRAGLRVRVICTHIAGGFGATYKREDASTIGTLAAVGAIDFHSFDSGDGLGLAWHGVGMGGASAIS